MHPFTSYPTPEAWAAEHIPREDLLYKEGQAAQLSAMHQIAGQLGCDVRIAGQHLSKSVPLPVAAYLLAPGLIALVRDNFHDVNVAVVADRPVTLPLSVVYSARDGAWYREQCSRAAEYSPGQYDFHTTEWWSEWSGGKLFEQEGSYYVAHHCFLQGISTVCGELPAYEPGLAKFCVCVKGRSDSLELLTKVQQSFLG